MSSNSITFNIQTISDQERYQITIGSIIASSFSLVGFLFVLTTYAMIKKIRLLPTIKYVICLSFADLILTLSGLIEPVPSSSINPTFCAIMGFLNQFGRMSSLLWTSVFAYSLFIVLKTSILNANSFNKYLMICFISPLIISFIPLVTTNWYGNASIYCWISASLDPTLDTILVTLFFYGWYPLAVIFNIVFYCKAISLLQNNATTIESKATFYQLLFYPLILILCWGPAFVDRYEISLYGINNTTLRFFHVFLVQFQGFLNSIAYGMNYYVRSALKSKFKSLFRKISQSGSSDSLDSEFSNGKIESEISIEFEKKKKPLFSSF